MWERGKHFFKRATMILAVVLLCVGNAYLIEEIESFGQKKTEALMEQTWQETIYDAGNEEQTNLESFNLEDVETAASEVAEKKYAYLTFDDGPSDNTDEILDILKEKNVKATFFVVGKEGETAQARYKRILAEGHSLGMHSYTHDYSYIYTSMDNYKEDILRLQNYLYEVTGQKVRLYRFPGGSSNSVAKISIKECIQFLNENDIVYFDWNASSEDAVTVNADCNKLNSNILQDALRFQNAVILMHDLHECDGTVDGLAGLIDRLIEEGYELRPITEETKPVQHVKSEG